MAKLADDWLPKPGALPNDAEPHAADIGFVQNIL
jgi:hypothetical protein